MLEEVLVSMDLWAFPVTAAIAATTQITTLHGLLNREVFLAGVIYFLPILGVFLTGRQIRSCFLNLPLDLGQV